MRPGEVIALLADSVRDFSRDECPTQAAALSYYTIFSLPPLLAVLLLILGSVLDPRDVQGQLEQQIGALMGPTAVDQIRTILQQARGGHDRRIWAAVGVPLADRLIERRR